MTLHIRPYEMLIITWCLLVAGHALASHKIAWFLFGLVGALLVVVAETWYHVRKDAVNSD